LTGVPAAGEVAADGAAADGTAALGEASWEAAALGDGVAEPPQAATTIAATASSDRSRPGGAGKALTVQAPRHG
jgi:hypothetical protein